MTTIHAIFENGVFRPTAPVALPDRTEVEFEPRVVIAESTAAPQDRIRELLAARFKSGNRELAARHNEYQP